MSFFRPDSAAAVIRRDAGLAHADSHYVLSFREQRAGAVRRAHSQLQDLLLDRELGRLLIDILVDAGGSKRSISALKAAGYRTVRDVALRQPSQLAAVRGIGEAGSQSVHAAAKRVKRNLEQDYRLRLEPGNRSVQADALVSALQEYRLATETPRGVLSVAKSVRRGLRQGLEATALADHPWRYLFSGSGAKQQLSLDLATLKQYLVAEASTETRAYAGHIRRSAGLSGIEAIWDLVESDQSTFYSLLASASGSEEVAAADLGNLAGDASPAGVSTDTELTGLVNRIRSSELDVTDHLRVVLRPYQVFGAQFAIEQRRIILGDEMGLGKTIEAIAVMCHLAHSGKTHFVVAAPLSLVNQWAREVANKSNLRIHRPHASRLFEGLRDWSSSGGVAIFSMDTLKSVPPALLRDAEVGLLVIDEAQMAKNPRTMRSIGLRRWIQFAERTLMLTGSPLENRVEDFLALESLLRPSETSLLPQSARYSPERFRRAVAPIYLRRQQADVLKELPPIIHSDEWVSLTEAESRIYSTAGRSRNFHTLRKAAFSRKIAEPTKLARIHQIVADARANDKKVVVFSFYRDVLKRVVESLEGESPMFGPLDGSVPMARRDMIVTDFTDAPGHAVLVAQIVTGGQGLNLQCASVAILCEPQLKPSSESQAVARLQRMGQSARVQVYRLIGDRTVDESLVGMLERKQRIFDEYAGKSDVADEVQRILDMGEKQLVDAIVDAEFERVGGTNPEAL